MEMDSCLQLGDDKSSEGLKKLHPARTLPFDELCAIASSYVQQNKIERSVDAETGLETYSYLISDSKCDNSSVDLTLSMFRGLILHPESKTVVATPFVRFFRSKMFDLNSRANRVVRASVKYDGSLIIAFRWKGDLLTSTRRRMNSEQAVIARDILRQSLPVQQEFREGWTYLLELIGGNNMHISQYATTQSLVLLSVFDSDGIEVDVSERVSIAERAELLYPTTIYGYIKDIADIAQGQGIVSAAPADSEGWVVEDPMDGARFKLINSSWDKTSIAVKSLVHPCVVWRSLLMCNFQSLQSNPYLPLHARKEMNLMADAIISNALGPIRTLICKHVSASTYQSVGCDGCSCGSCEGLAHCQKCWILIAAGFAECYYCLDKESSSLPLRQRDQAATSSKFPVPHTSLITAVKAKDPISVVSLLSLADDMDVSVDVEDIVVRSTAGSQWDCSSMLPIDEQGDNVRTVYFSIFVVVHTYTISW